MEKCLTWQPSWCYGKRWFGISSTNLRLSQDPKFCTYFLQAQPNLDERDNCALFPSVLRYPGKETASPAFAPSARKRIP